MTDQSHQSNETIHVDTAKLTPAIAKFHQLSSRLDSIGTGFDLLCQSYGEAWGDDKIGHQFYSKYEPGHVQLIDAAHDASKGFSVAADNVANLVKAYENIAENARAHGHNLRVTVDPGGEQHPSPGSNP